MDSNDINNKLWDLMEDIESGAVSRDVALAQEKVIRTLVANMRLSFDHARETSRLPKGSKAMPAYEFERKPRAGAKKVE